MMMMMQIQVKKEMTSEDDSKVLEQSSQSSFNQQPVEWFEEFPSQAHMHFCKEEWN